VTTTNTTKPANSKDTKPSKNTTTATSPKVKPAEADKSGGSSTQKRSVFRRDAKQSNTVCMYVCMYAGFISGGPGGAFAPPPLEIGFPYTINPVYVCMKLHVHVHTVTVAVAGRDYKFYVNLEMHVVSQNFVTF
jgi:hypothetical protein